MNDNSPTGTPTPPPAAQTVVTGTKTERELELERELENERKIRKDREVSLAHFQDENTRLRAIPGPPPAAPAKKSGGWTFFDENED
jgi:hypothetical protein